jgi:hypothetical protein
MLEESERGWRDPELVPLFAGMELQASDVPDAAWPADVSMQESLDNMRRQLSK